MFKPIASPTIPDQNRTANNGAPILRADPNAAIIEKMARGDASGLSELMQRHLPQIKSMAWHLLGDEMEAEDIAQEVFIKAWQNAPIWKPGKAQFSTWMHRVGKNMCYDRLRKKKPLYVETVPEILDTDSSALNTMINDETSAQQQKQMRAALNQLPPRHLTAITLSHFEQKSQKEAAQIMGLSIRAYESLLARGRKGLKLILTPNRILPPQGILTKENLT